jgi:predicted nucleic acid-binding protein
MSEITRTLVDSNVLLDILTEDRTWSRWSADALIDAAESGPLFINSIIYAEVSIRFSRIEELDDALPEHDFRRLQLPWAAAFLAGKAFVSYRQRRGTKRSPLPDFLIGAHAAVASLDLLTRDQARFATYFPTVRLIHPESTR